MDSDRFRIFYGMTMKTLYVTPCDAHTKQLLWTCLVYITKCVPDTKNKKNTIQTALNEVFSGTDIHDLYLGKHFGMQMAQLSFWKSSLD